MKRKRKEVKLPDEVLDKLQKLADKKGWSLKRYMEYVLSSKSMQVK